MALVSALAPGALRGTQALRFIAALMVVILHANNRTHWSHPGYDPGQLQFLDSGVDIFFVISGFIMVQVLKPGTRPLEFAALRFMRVAPLYWIATAAAFVFSVWFSPNLFKAMRGGHRCRRHLSTDMVATARSQAGLNLEVGFCLLLAACLFRGDRRAICRRSRGPLS